MGHSFLIQLAPDRHLSRFYALILVNIILEIFFKRNMGTMLQLHAIIIIIVITMITLMPGE